MFKVLLLLMERKRRRPKLICCPVRGRSVCVCVCVCVCGGGRQCVTHHVVGVFSFHFFPGFYYTCTTMSKADEWLL